MGRKKAPSKMPYLTPPFKPIFQTLPPELLHVIFSKLSIEDILALRTSCSVLASVGLDHLEDEIPLVFHRDKFKALTEIAKHPKLSKQMRSLFYVVDRCKVQSFEKWDHCRPDPHPEDQEDYDRDAKFYTERDFRACAREGKKDFYKFLKRMAAVPDSERRSAHERFCALCQDIADVEDEGYDLSCLRLLFEKCPRIREVMIGSQMDIAQVSYQLPQLRCLRLRGAFYLDGDSEIEFEHAGCESRRIASYRDAVENFILKGGEYPTDDETVLPDQANYPDENYKGPGLRQDNTEPDDPMLDYDSDNLILGSNAGNFVRLSNVGPDVVSPTRCFCTMK
ncbi:hypothetical protein MBLNU13_g03684t1 [Cladosporium sp. NU13]